jgi:hypothetical protein
VKIILVSGQCLLQTVWEQGPLVTVKERTYVALIEMQFLAWKTLTSAACLKFGLIHGVNSKNTSLIFIIISTEGISLI